MMIVVENICLERFDEFVYLIRCHLVVKFNVILFVGGRYSGEMKVNECTHLVLHTPKGI